MRGLDIHEYDMRRLTDCIARQQIGKWREYAPEEWFRRHERECERTLGDFFGVVGSEVPGGRLPLARVAGT
jgi:hypothetical protein